MSVFMGRGHAKALEAEMLMRILALALLGQAGAAEPRAIVKSEFVYESAPFPSAHASTIVETPSGLVTAWFGGTREKHPDVGIWVSRLVGGTWSVPIEVATGVQADGSRLPCWNPVLFLPAKGPLLLFYKVGPSPSEWGGLVRTSMDDGKTWSEALRLPDGVLGPIRAKPVALPNGELLAGSSTEHAGWVVHMERFVGRYPADLASPSAWQKTAPLNDRNEFGAIQPTILQHEKARLQILCRSRQGVITEAWSEDAGKSWGKMTATSLPNPSAGIDAVRLKDGRFWLVYNPSTKGRGQLEIASSRDGKSWQRALLLEDTSGGEFSYPAMIVAKDGLVHVTYTWQRQKIKHVVVDPARID
jgi:predicted neuraminidase